MDPKYCEMYLYLCYTTFPKISPDYTILDLSIWYINQFKISNEYTSRNHNVADFNAMELIQLIESTLSYFCLSK